MREAVAARAGALSSHPHLDREDGQACGDTDSEGGAHRLTCLSQDTSLRTRDAVSVFRRRRPRGMIRSHMAWVS